MFQVQIGLNRLGGFNGVEPHRFELVGELLRGGAVGGAAEGASAENAEPASARLQPPPAATPLTATTTGTAHSRIARKAGQ